VQIDRCTIGFEFTKTETQLGLPRTTGQLAERNVSNFEPAVGKTSIQHTFAFDQFKRLRFAIGVPLDEWLGRSQRIEVDHNQLVS
jgi:hypothetical protein